MKPCIHCYSRAYAYEHPLYMYIQTIYTPLNTPLNTFIRPTYIHALKQPIQQVNLDQQGGSNSPPVRTPATPVTTVWRGAATSSSTSARPGSTEPPVATRRRTATATVQKGTGVLRGPRPALLRRVRLATTVTRRARPPISVRKRMGLYVYM